MNRDPKSLRELCADAQELKDSGRMTQEAFDELLARARKIVGPETFRLEAMAPYDPRLGWP